MTDEMTDFVSNYEEPIETPTALIKYRMAGKGPPLLLVHGWPLAGATFRELVGRLKHDFTCIVPDVPGGGETEWRETTDFSWPGQARNMKLFMDQVLDKLEAERGLVEKRYFLLGQDSGAMISRVLALMDRERIRKLAMTNTEIPDYHPLLLWWTWWSTRFKPIFNTLFRLSLRFRLGRWVLFRTYFDNNGTIEGDFHKYVLRPMYQDPRKVDGHRRFLNGWEWDLLDQMEWLHGIIAMPTRLMWGENDKNFPVAKAEVMAEQFPHGCIVEKFADAELAVHEDQPKLLAEALTKFYLP